MGGPKFRAFFFPLPLFLSLTMCLLVVFWWCLKRRGRQMCTLGVLGLSCEAPAAPKPPAGASHVTEAAGASHDSPRAQTRTFEGSGLQKTPKFNDKTPRERQKEQKCGGRGEKKSEILGGPAEGGPAEGGPEEGCPAEGGPVEGPTQHTPTTHNNTQHTTHNTHTTTHTHTTNTTHTTHTQSIRIFWPNAVLAKCGLSNAGMTSPGERDLAGEGEGGWGSPLGGRGGWGSPGGGGEVSRRGRGGEGGDNHGVVDLHGRSCSLLEERCQIGVVPWAQWFLCARRGRKHAARFSSTVAFVFRGFTQSGDCVSLACSVFVVSRWAP